MKDKIMQFNPLQNNMDFTLCEETLLLAADYLTGKYQYRLCMSDFHLEYFDLSGEERHGKCALLIAEKAPLEINPAERLAGSAPLKEAIMHTVPGFRLKEGTPVRSISHTTVDFSNGVRLGLSGLEKEIRTYLEKAPDCKHPFYNGLLDVIQAMRLWVKRYIDEYRKMLEIPEYCKYEGNLRSVLANLQNVPENPPETFAEAVQSLWCFFEFQRLCGNWSGIGRIDELLGPFLQKDLEKGIITLQEAEEYLAHFWIKGTEWCFGLKSISKAEVGSGDAQNYQNIILSGIDEQGKHIENEVTFLVLDIVRQLHISDYPVSVRLNKHTSEKLLRKIGEVQLLGGGIVSVYNEELVLEALRKCHYPEKEARKFTNDGCWEILIPGQTNFSYYPLDMLIPFQEALFNLEQNGSFEELYAEFLAHVRLLAEKTRKVFHSYSHLEGKDPYDPGSYPVQTGGHADVILSLLMPSCRKYGCSYTKNGAEYILRALHMGGLPDVANSLYAVKKLVYERKRVSLATLREILEKDWQGMEEIRQEAANTIRYYGNDNEEADLLLKRVLEDCAEILEKPGRMDEVRYCVGVSTFGREIAYAANRKATPFGMNKGCFLAPNLSPTPGTDKSELSAVLNSYCRMDFTKTPNGCPLDLRLSAGIRKVPDAPGVLAQVLRVFQKKGGMYLQIDTVDADILRAAQKEPDRFPNLAVRISGWSARFASLSKQWQDMLINRTALEI